MFSDTVSNMSQMDQLSNFGGKDIHSFPVSELELISESEFES